MAAQKQPAAMPQPLVPGTPGNEQEQAAMRAEDAKLGVSACATSKEVAQGETVHLITSDELASALIAVGVPYIKPLCVRRQSVDGRTSDTWTFAGMNSDKDLKTADLIKAWGNWQEFITKNPRHPFSLVICAIKNLPRLKRIKEATPITASFHHPHKKNQLIHAHLGSAEFEDYVRRGLKRL